MNTISNYRNEIVHAVETHNVVIISGNPDSYLSTYVPFYLLKAGFTDKGECKKNPPRICVVLNSISSVISSTDSCSALLSSSTRVTSILTVEGNYNKNADIVFMTDKVLLNKVLVDPLLSDYGVVVLTGVQERLLTVDILISLLNRILARRPRLRVVLCLESTHAEYIFHYFKRKDRASIADNKGLTPLDDVYYINILDNNIFYDVYYLSNPSFNYLDTIISTVLNICKQEGDGNILIFVPSVVQIELLYNSLSDISNKNRIFNIIPLHTEIKYKNTTVGVKRNVFICSNVNDYKFNVGEISHLIDSCLSRKMVSDYINTGMTECIMSSTRDIITHRAKIAKRGKCYRIIREIDYNDDKYIPESMIPEIRIRDLTSTVLLIKSLGISRLSDFEFITRPSSKSLEHALTILFLLKGVDAQGELLYPSGNLMAELPCTPYLSAFIYQSTQTGCSEEAITIYSMMQVKDILWKDSNKKTNLHLEKLDAAKHSFAAIEGDLVSYFNLYQLANYYKDEDDKWLSRHMVKRKGITLAENIRNKLKKTLNKYQLELTSCGTDVEKLLTTIFSTFFYNVACKEHLIKNLISSRQLDYERTVTTKLVDDEGNPLLTNELQPYILLRCINDNKQLFINPASFIANEQPDWIVFNETSENEGYTYMHDVTAIKPDYLQTIVPHFFGESDIQPYLSNFKT